MADKLKIRPLEDRVVVEPLEAEEKTKGGILLPDSAKREAAARQASSPSARARCMEDGKRSGDRPSPSATRCSTASYSPATTSKSRRRRKIKIMRESDILAKILT